MTDAITAAGSSNASLLKELLALRQAFSSSEDSTGDTTDSTSTSSSDSSTTTAQDDVASAFQQLDSDLQSLLIQLQNGSASDSDASTVASVDSNSSSGQPDFSTLFSKLDTNGDGSITESEFVAGRPSGMSEADAESMWSKIDGSGASSLTESEFVSDMEENGPGSTTGSGSLASELQSLTADLHSLLQTIDAAESDGSTSTSSSGAST